MSTPIDFRPHCTLLKINDKTYHLYMQVFLPSGYILQPHIPDESNPAIFTYKFATAGSGGAIWPHWEGLSTPIVISKTLPAGADCATHRVEVEVHNGVVDAHPEGKTIIRTIDADANSG